MIKKTIEKESYLAPEWGLRVIRVERHFMLNDSNTSDDEYDDNELGEV